MRPSYDSKFHPDKVEYIFTAYTRDFARKIEKSRAYDQLYSPEEIARQKTRKKRALRKINPV